MILNTFSGIFDVAKLVSGISFPGECRGEKNLNSQRRAGVVQIARAPTQIRSMSRSDQSPSVDVDVEIPRNEQLVTGILMKERTNMSFRAVAEKVHIPFQTLARAWQAYTIQKALRGWKNTLNGGNPVISRGIGATGYLTPLEEVQLAEIVKALVAANESPTRRELFATARRHFPTNENLKRIPGFSTKWIRGFSKRHNLVLRIPSEHTGAKRKTHSRANVTNWWAKYERVVVEQKIGANILTGEVSETDFESCVWNFDETSVNFDTLAEKVLTTRGHQPRRVKLGGDENVHITLLEGTNMAGQFAKPCIIISGKSPEDFSRLTENAIHRKQLVSAIQEGGGLVMFSQNGSMLSQFLGDFFRWCHSFMDKTRNNLIILDGHKSHVSSIDALKWAAAHNLVILRLPPQMTDVLQPMDVGVFATFKLRWKQAVSLLSTEIKSDPSVSIDEDFALETIETDPPIENDKSVRRRPFDLGRIAACLQITRSALIQETYPSTGNIDWKPPHDFDDVSFPSSVGCRLVRSAYAKTGIGSPIFVHDRYPKYMTPTTTQAMWSQVRLMQEFVLAKLGKGDLYPDETCCQARGSELTSRSYLDYLEKKQLTSYREAEAALRKPRKKRAQSMPKSDSKESAESEDDEAARESEPDTEPESSAEEDSTPPQKRKQCVEHTDFRNQSTRQRNSYYCASDLGPVKTSYRRV